MNELTLTELDMGMCTPRILWASQPIVDYQGKLRIYLHLSLMHRSRLRCGFELELGHNYEKFLMCHMMAM